jgi:hypothetical protein
MKKIVLEVLCKFDINGVVTPIKIVWPDGREYEIDKIIEITRAAAHNIGGTGIRYTVRILNKETYIWREGDAWYMEGK